MHGLEFKTKNREFIAQFIDAGAERAIIPMPNEITGSPCGASIKQRDEGQ